MKIIFNTGYIVMYGSDISKHHSKTGGVLKELGVNIKRFLDLYGQEDGIYLRVCTTRNLWDILKEKYPFVLHPSILFLDYQEVLKKQNLSENEYWYDALRFQVLSTIEESEDCLEYWIDEDALVEDEHLLNDVCKEHPNVIVSPVDWYPWNKSELQKDLQEYKDIFNSFGLKASPKPEDYSNTGTFFGGPSKDVKFISTKILEVERAFRRNSQPSAAVLEYVSCCCFREFCSIYNIPYLTLDINKYVWHYTGYRIPRQAYLDALWIKYPEDIEYFRDFCDERTEAFRLRYITETFNTVLTEDTSKFSKSFWKELAIKLYSGSRGNFRIQKSSLV